ncbi:MAG TPA: hypothetical protein VNM71_12290 [Steroidobacteraceae bacterium]|nr:hypothetical protein [Steroidobacteraceae bacterium]
MLSDEQCAELFEAEIKPDQLGRCSEEDCWYQVLKSELMAYTRKIESAARADQQAEIDTLREQLAAAQADMRERAAKICDDRASRNESAAQRAIENDEREEVPYLRAAAWQMSVCANDIRALPATPEATDKENKE